MKRQNDNTLPGLAWNGLNYCAGQLELTSNESLFLNQWNRFPEPLGILFFFFKVMGWCA